MAPPVQRVPAPVALLVSTGAQPPVTLAVASHAWKAASSAAWSAKSQALTVVATGVVITTGVAGVTVNVAVAVGDWQRSVAVNVTVMAPPVQRVPAPVALLVSTGAQPPVTLAVASHAWKAASSAAWSAKSQALTVVATGVVITTGVAGVTVNVGVAVGDWQRSVAVNVTVMAPPVQSVPAPVALLVSTGAQPPVTLAVASHAWKAASSAAWSAKSQALTVVATGVVITTGVAGVTVNVAVAVGDWQRSVAVNVTVMAPPVQRVPAPVALLVSTGAQPPVTLAVANHAWKAASSAAWSAKSQALTVVATGVVITTGVAGVTVNVAVAVGDWQRSVAVNVTVMAPPVQRVPAPVALLVSTGAQPPVTLAVASHAWKAASSAAWFAKSQTLTVVATGVVITTGVAGVTVNVAVAVGDWQRSVAVNVTVMAPPVQSVPAPVALLVSTGAQPPVTEAVASHAWKAASSAAWFAKSQALTVVATGVV